jgi:hypothetical protein
MEAIGKVPANMNQAVLIKDFRFMKQSCKVVSK